MRWRFILFVILVAPGAWTMPVHAQTMPDAFSSNGQGTWTVDRVCAALQWRESLLQSSSAKYEQTMWLADLGKEQLFQQSIFDIRYRGASTRFSASIKYLTLPELSSESEQFWDLSRYVDLVKKVDKKGRVRWSCGIGDWQPNLLAHSPVFSVEGLRFQGYAMSWSNLIRTESNMKGTTSTVKEETSDGQQVVTLTIAPGEGDPVEFVGTFLPAKDFVLQDFVMKPHDRADARGLSEIDTYHAEELKQFDNLWMPAKTTVTVKDRGPFSSRYLIDLQTLSLRRPSQDEMAIACPTGTQVLDAINHTAYIVEANQQKRAIAFFDSSTGKLVKPTTRGSESIDATPAPGPGD